jgi:hypothetical protein
VRVRPRALAAPRGANCIIEGKGVPALAMGPRGARGFSRTSRAFRNTFYGRAQGVGRILHL